MPLADKEWLWPSRQHSKDPQTGLRTLQELLGHKILDTTMIYTHVMAEPEVGVPSPVDALDRNGPVAALG